MFRFLLATVILLSAGLMLPGAASGATTDALQGRPCSLDEAKSVVQARIRLACWASNKKTKAFTTEPFTLTVPGDACKKVRDRVYDCTAKITVHEVPVSHFTQRIRVYGASTFPNRMKYTAFKHRRVGTLR